LSGGRLGPRLATPTWSDSERTAPDDPDAAQATEHRDGGGGCTYAYSYWMNEFSQESLRTQGEYSDYLGFAGRIANDYQEMFIDDGC
jgi:hypothetical protein